MLNGRKHENTLRMACNVLRQMLELAAAKDDPSVCPPQKLFQHMLTLWSASYQKDAGERAAATLLQMQDHQAKDCLPPLK